MRRLIAALIGLVLGYATGAAIAAGAIMLLSGNTHDKSTEVAMTSLLIGGPIGALIGFFVGLVRGGEPRK